MCHMVSHSSFVTHSMTMKLDLNYCICFVILSGVGEICGGDYKLLKVENCIAPHHEILELQTCSTPSPRLNITVRFLQPMNKIYVSMNNLFNRLKTFNQEFFVTVSLLILQEARNWIPTVFQVSSIRMVRSYGWSKNASEYGSSGYRSS